MKGILLTEILFNKTVAKEKTMTRRAPATLKVINENPDDWKIHQIVNYKQSGTMLGVHFKNINRKHLSAKPTYKVGEIVYIKEPYHEDELGIIRYKYDFPEDNEWRNKTKFKNKLFVGAKYGRHFIRIISVKVERLYDISDEDCLKEGVEQRIVVDPEFDIPVRGFRNYLSMSDWFATGDGMFTPEQRSFFSLFRFANRVPKSKEIPNIWCFAYSYVLCDKEGNEL